MTFPLFIVAGTSGSGKTTVSYEVQKVLGVGFNVYDMDTIVVKQDFQTACNNWIRIAYHNALGGNTTILFGAVPYPYNVFVCDHFHHFDQLHYLLLHCNQDTRNQRLTERGGWTPNGIQQTIAYGEKQYAEFKRANFPIINTTDTPVTQVAEQIKEWVLKPEG
ncbi:hypothetical protein DFQ01_10599 [Paenibacillus cellulosilyticus]|uniref:Broad-specificity NMP kinase n=1 Tax=Paenibacillus cellulosilyticus TaxID=375489 RepID=A0A2V2YWI2_9BACL|nr:AAA family ATPase [Paenibacillus cellulosilyticus]PWW05116.1 hypothetical protein DFQ01_10599 [Paenibacillus cellulosilyticus]QKS48665.1 AAA family ATPase [Paenibacillus cellulosilyticus]